MEEELIASDVSINTTDRIITSLRDRAYEEKINSAEEVKEALYQEIVEILKTAEGPELALPRETPAVYLIVGVNGVGKTSAIAKLANMFKSQGFLLWHHFTSLTRPKPAYAAIFFQKVIHPEQGTHTTASCDD